MLFIAWFNYAHIVSSSLMNRANQRTDQLFIDSKYTLELHALLFTAAIALTVVIVYFVCRLLKICNAQLNMMWSGNISSTKITTITTNELASKNHMSFQTFNLVYACVSFLFSVVRSVAEISRVSSGKWQCLCVYVKGEIESSIFRP